MHQLSMYLCVTNAVSFSMRKNEVFHKLVLGGIELLSNIS